MASIVGIDLGTTFSGLAVLNSVGKAEIVPNAGGDRITPSAIFFEENGSALIGGDAINARRFELSRSVRWIKRQMGEPVYPERLAGREWTPAELSSLILKKLKQDCSRQVGAIEDAVITVPAYFDDVRRKATMDAGRMAGLNVVGIINEPTAAALHAAVSRNISGRTLVYDLGGGTFDVTVLDVNGSHVNVVCSQGHHQLGGYDFDQRLLERFASIYRQKKRGELYTNPEEKARQEDEAEDAKKALSHRLQVGIMLRGSNGDLPIIVTREEFEEDIAAYLASIDMLIETALEEAGSKPSDFKQIVLVGGSTRMPVVQQRLGRTFGSVPIVAVNVDECVALGAALYAGLRLVEEAPGRVPDSVALGLGNIKLVDVCNHSYGTLCLGMRDECTRERGLVHSIVIPKNTPIPAERAETYFTVADGQTSVNVRVTTGEESDPEYVKVLFEGNLGLPPNRPAGRPIRVTFTYDSNGRMHCTFLDVESGKDITADLDMARSDTPDHKQAAVSSFLVE